MKCILISSHGDDIDSLLTLSEDFPKPVRKPGQVLIKVHTCALAPGDIRVMKGHCDFFQSPRGFPYIPGGDIAGVVEEADENSRFNKGDRVLCMFDLPRPLDGLAEYACAAKESLVEKIPDSMSFADAAALTSSALAAYSAAEAFIEPGNRVLILGGSGGVGTFLIQMAKNAGATFIATTSTAEALVKSLGADCVINYKKENFWDVPAFKKEQFDVIIDLGVGRKEAWQKAKAAGVLKPGKDGGKYVTLIGDDPELELHNIWQVLGLLFRFPRGLWTRLWPFVPRYFQHTNALEVKEGVFSEIVGLVEEGKLRVVIDPHSTTSLQLDLEAVKKCFHVMEKRGGHGKVVIQIAP